MRKNIWIYGLLSGTINMAYMIMLGMKKENPDFSNGMVYGYLAMVVSLSFVFVGVYKTKQLLANEPFGFGKAFLTGLWISLISACMYALGWMLVNKFMYPTFMSDYVNFEISQMKLAGTSEKELQLFAKQMKDYEEMYQNPFLAFLITLSEILPVGFLFSALAAWFFKKK